jgi:hypothetical protein
MANSISAATGGKGGAAPGDIISNVLLEFRVLAVDNLSDPTPRYYCTYSSPLLPALTSPQQSSSLSFSKPSTEHNFVPFLYLATGYRLLLRIIHYPLSIIHYPVRARFKAVAAQLTITGGEGPASHCHWGKGCAQVRALCPTTAADASIGATITCSTTAIQPQVPAMPGLPPLPLPPSPAGLAQ